MKILKVVAEGLTTSFRYPHFMLGVQPTFEMPPPATIYGHVCSVLGEWIDPVNVIFAINFSYQARFNDIEHIHMLGPSSGKLKHTNKPKVLEGKINPFTREQLFRPRLVLYLNRPEWLDKFMQPAYPVALGRTQDLFTYTSVEVIEAHESDRAYIEKTLAPYDYSLRTAKGIAVLMPRYIDYRNGRLPEFERYMIIHRRVHSHEFINTEGQKQPKFYIDPTSEEINGDKLALLFHSWVDREKNRPKVA